MSNSINKELWVEDYSLNYFDPDVFIASASTGIINSGYFDAGVSGWFSGIQTNVNKDIYSHDVIDMDGLSYFNFNINADVDFSSLIFFKKSGIKNAILLSSVDSFYNPSSGFVFGINDSNFLFFEYLNNVEGRRCYTSTVKIENNSVCSISRDRYNISMSSFNLNKKMLTSDTFKIPYGLFNWSNDFYVCGNPHIDSGCVLNNFSGSLINFIFISGLYLQENSVNAIFNTVLKESANLTYSGELNYETGFVGIDPLEEVRVEFIYDYLSGYSGSLYNIGPILSGYEKSGMHSFDINGEPIYNFIDNVNVYSDISGYVVADISGHFSSIYSGLPFFNFDSGIRLKYTQNLKSEIDKSDYFSDMYKNKNSLTFIGGYVPDKDDYVKLIICTGDGAYNYSKNVKFNFSNIEKCFYPFKGLNDFFNMSFSDIFINGIIQESGISDFNSSTYGNNYYVKSGDYYISNNLIKNSFENFYSDNTLIGDYLIHKQSQIKFNISSGSPHGIFITDDDLFFLNGQLLSYGIDYDENNYLLEQSGENKIFIASYPSGFFATGFHASGDIYVCDFFHNTSCLFVNGVRQNINVDYTESNRNDNINENNFIDFAASMYITI
jgi:hypothetical protein